MKDRGHINILIAGRTGVGKSTLINAIFREVLRRSARVAPSPREQEKSGKVEFPCLFLIPVAWRWQTSPRH
ncbi:MAG: 50S ribosome-binding GTPase [Cyanobacteria bacterium]|nr:50S ribosome-binding GTPase [Cyanobacteriota bacterium]